MASTKNELETENRNLAQKVQKLQKTIGSIRRDVARITAPGDHADTLREVMKVIDKTIAKV